MADEFVRLIAAGPHVAPYYDTDFRPHRFRFQCHLPRGHAGSQVGRPTYPTGYSHTTRVSGNLASKPHAKVVAFVEQRRHDLRWRTVHEAWAGEHIEDLLALGFTQRPGGRWTGLLVPGS